MHGTLTLGNLITFNHQFSVIPKSHLPLGLSDTCHINSDLFQPAFKLSWYSSHSRSFLAKILLLYKIHSFLKHDLFFSFSLCSFKEIQPRFYVLITTTLSPTYCYFSLSLKRFLIRSFLKINIIIQFLFLPFLLLCPFPANVPLTFSRIHRPFLFIIMLTYIA